MLNAILAITRARFLVARNTFWRGNIRRKIGLVALGVALAAAAWGIYSLVSLLVGYLNSSQFPRDMAAIAREAPEVNLPTDVSTYLQAVPSALLFVALLMLVLTSFSTVLSSLYLSGDIDMLLVAPVPMRAVFIVKFFSGLLVPYLLMFVLLLPALFGFGSGMGYGPLYYVVLVFVLLLLPLLPLSLGALLVMAVVRVIPARRAREIVGVISGLAGIAWYTVSQFSRQIGQNVSGAQTLGLLQYANNPLLPSAWAGRALNAAGIGEWATLLAFGGLFAALSLGAFAGALVLGERVYYEGWANMATQGGRARRSRARRATAGGGGALLGRLLPPESAAILYKDLRVFPRDLRNIQQLIFPLVIAGIWTFNLITNRQVTDALGGEQVGSALNLLFPVGITTFICLSISTALGGPNISREGRGFWQLKIAPISSMRLLLGKFVLAYAPYPIIGTLFLLLIAFLQRSSPTDTLIALALMLMAGLGLCAISCGLGAAFPRFNWEKPSEQSTIQTGCLAPLLYMLYLGLLLGFAVGLPLLGTLFAEQLGALHLLVGLLGWLLALGLTAGVVALLLSFGARRLDRLEVA